MRRGRRHHPIFDFYTIPELAVKLNRSQYYLWQLSRGYKPCSKAFRKMCMAILGKRESTLFDPDLP